MNIASTRPSLVKTAAPVSSLSRSQAETPVEKIATESFQFSVDSQKTSLNLGGLKLQPKHADVSLGVAAAAGMGTLVFAAATGRSYLESLVGGASAFTLTGASAGLGYSLAGPATNAVGSLILGAQIAEHLGVGAGLAIGLGLAAATSSLGVKMAQDDNLSPFGGVLGAGLAAANVAMALV